MASEASLTRFAASYMLMATQLTFRGGGGFLDIIAIYHDSFHSSLMLA